MRRASLAIAALAAVQVAAAQTRPHNFDLIDVNWSVKLLPETSSLVGDVVNTLRAEKGAKSITLDFGSLTIDDIEVDGKPAKYQRAKGEIRIQLPTVANGQKTSAVRVKYHGKPGTGVYFVPAERAYPAKTPVVYTQGEMVDNRYWLPTYDYPDDKATTQGTIDVPTGWFALSNGKLLSSASKAGRTVYKWKMDQAHATYLISFVAGPYEKGHEMWEGIPVDYYVPTGLLDQGKAAFEGTADVVRFYSELTGFRYPYAKYSQSAVPDFMFGGMENITCTTQTITTLHPASVEPLADSLGLVAHELAHQWFGDTITCNGWSDAWINEGWASFLPSFYMREKRGQEVFDMDRYGTFQGGLAAHRDDPNRPVVWKGYKEALDMFNNFIYPGGASRMFMLMHQVGEEKFWKATAAYLNERKYTSFDTPAFFETYSKNLGIDLKPFMQQWFYTAGAPNLTVTVEDKNLVITQTAPYFDLDVPVWVLDGGDWKKLSTHISQARTELPLGDLAGKPVLIDPECWIMANIDSKVPLTEAEAMAVFNAAPNAAEQCRIMDTMLGDLSPANRLALAQSMKSNRLRQRFLGRLGAESADYLLELTKDADRSLANTAADRLGRLPATQAAISRLRELSTEDPNDILRQTAFSALLRLTDDPALALQAWKKEGYHDGYRQIALDWWERKDKDSCRFYALQALSGGFAEPTRVNAIGRLGRLKDKPGEKTVYNALAAVLKESSFGARNTAINALAEYGDPAALPLIESYLDAELVFFRNSARSASERIRKSAGLPPK